jgi:hypothetical protein
VGALKVGASLVGALKVGASLVGALKVGASLVGALKVGASLVGALDWAGTRPAPTTCTTLRYITVGQFAGKDTTIHRRAPIM